MIEKSGHQMKEITKQLEEGIRQLYDSDKYAVWLDVMSKFHNYSFRNCMLIAMQKPDATHVAGFKKWQSLERHVMKGEKGIRIIAPSPFKIKTECMQKDSDGNTVLDAWGNAVYSEVEINIPSYKVITVFDISQTKGKPLPEITSMLADNDKDYGTLIEAACIYSSVPVNIIEINNGSNGFFDRNTNSIGIKSGMSESQTFKTIIHETAHSLLHAEDDDKSRNQKEVEAESVAYAVCRHFGIDASDYSFGYIAGWSRNDDLKEFRSSLELIQKTADGIITGIEEKQKVLDKGIENEKAVLYLGTDEPGNIIKM